MKASRRYRFTSDGTALELDAKSNKTSSPAGKTTTSAKNINDAEPTQQATPPVTPAAHDDTEDDTTPDEHSASTKIDRKERPSSTLREKCIMPRRAASAYVYFVGDHRDRIHEENPEVRFGKP